MNHAFRCRGMILRIRGNRVTMLAFLTRYAQYNGVLDGKFHVDVHICYGRPYLRVDYIVIWQLVRVLVQLLACTTTV